jgi:hypothetical protein
MVFQLRYAYVTSQSSSGLPDPININQSLQARMCKSYMCPTSQTGVRYGCQAAWLYPGCQHRRNERTPWPISSQQR